MSCTVACECVSGYVHAKVRAWLYIYIYIGYIHLAEVELAVKQLKNGKATGCDDISAEVIKASGELGISLLHKLIVKIWQTGEWPETSSTYPYTKER